MPSADLLSGLGDIDLSEPQGSFADFAARIAGLDLLITVDTAAAHLAGALGIPAYVLLPYLGADWRWLKDRSDSPWYPSLKLFRQPMPGDWDGALMDFHKHYVDAARGADSRRGRCAAGPAAWKAAGKGVSGSVSG
jgi:ADP-heptose:LPS heptosyltransferase